ncbi:TMV resistance protein N-like [Eucalyptus grandis]|uniref:TMV resistance protein N-like n=1 Tax=Eucalyptus grandis TaxID=71139 RepID=UPI00192E7AAD|nr:TMV resistance protein N-like [Eucalyptus grandis]
MKGTGVRVFRDDDEIQGGQNIKDELWQAIESSKIYMPVFSKTYASSKWCLKELAKMTEVTSRSNGTKEILPIFFDVSPGDVKLKTSLYKNELSNHAKMYEADKVKAWEKALMEVGKLKGWKPRNVGHGRLITSVVEDVLIKLNNRNKILTKHLVEDRKQVDAVMELLDINSGGTHSVGIRGIGGIGKTTLAKVIFNKLSPHFDCSSFLENVREISRRSDGLVYLQKKLLSSIHRSRNNELYDVDCGIDMIRRQLSNKKVLIVVDDMEEKDLLEKLVGECDGLKSGSRVIITTRNLSAIRNEPKTILDYEVKEMESDQSLQLFCRHAFGKDFPPGDYESLAREIVSTLGNLPLAVEVIGSSLSCKHDNRALWIEVLEKLRKAPLGKVRESLMISYEELEKEQKQVFLDIACLFVQEDKTYPIFMWSDCNYYPNYAIDVLLHRSPIKVESDSKFRMNDQVRDLGRHIVQEGDYGKKLKALDLRNCKCLTRTRLVKLRGVGDIDTRWLLQILDLSCTRISGLPATITYPSHLEELHVRDCRDLTGEIPDAIGRLSCLRVLDFSGTCISGLPATISFLPCLKELGLKECEELRLVPKLPSSLISLVLDAYHCEIIPDLSNLVTLDHLDLSFHRYKLKAPYQLEELLSPWKIVESIHQLPSSLSTLHLTDIPPPQQFSNFMNLSSLSISSCSMAHLPELEHLKKLRELSIKVCPSLERIPDLSCLKSLETLYLSELGSLVAIQGLEELESLESLQIICCESLEGLPQLSKLVKLKSFELHDCHVLQAIEGLGCLQRLKHLTILGCVTLKRLPDYPRSTKLDTDWKEPETSSAD